MMISGGQISRWISGEERLFSSDRVEVISPSKGDLDCKIPNMTQGRRDHTMVGNLVCGGLYDDLSTSVSSVDTCIRITTGGWDQSHILKLGRYDHMSWAVDDDVILMGGIMSTGNRGAGEIVRKEDNITELTGTANAN